MFHHRVFFQISHDNNDSKPFLEHEDPDEANEEEKNVAHNDQNSDPDSRKWIPHNKRAQFHKIQQKLTMIDKNMTLVRHLLN